MLLGEIAEIKTGLVLTRKKATIEYNVQATYKLLTLKNIDEDGRFNDEPFDEFDSSERLESHYFTVEGDVLIRLSYPNTAICVGKEQSGLLVPSYFAIIKVDKRKFSPDYIAWYLNLDIVKKELERSQAGTRIPSTNKNVLKTITVISIELSKQHAITQLLKLHHKEKSLYQKLIDEKEQLLKALSYEFIQESLKEEKR
ncbi:restriction endonuclease subunit S [Bacillus velezensis]|uniref:restriction endonuclease subunit S n=1 Tax=Bacillus velezensis TaxID=492670 RepID=UPI0024C0C827|nr:restriction endonuclease subunit S [Bacillus velezensis]WHY39218.1 restriction endonuclease subunit S [Bacillus velezensis]